MLTVDNIIKNPIKGSSHIAPRNIIINSLTANTYQLMQSGLINLISVTKTTTNDLEVHIAIGSKTVTNLQYDVILQFKNINYIDGNKIIDGVIPSKTELKVFSNSPEFVFIYAYAFNKRNYIINKYKTYLDARCLTEEPKVKNPSSDIGMSTSLFSALKYLEIIGFYGNYNYSKFLNNISTKPKTSNQVQSITNAFKIKNKRK